MKLRHEELLSMNNWLVLLLFCFIMGSCANHKKIQQQQSTQALQPIIIYKTKADYYFNIPVILSKDKQIIVSYPSVTDIYYQGELALPTKLKNEYLLDNRGINTNVAFTSYTYEEYSKLASPLNIDTLFNSIIDNNPLLELYNCGSRYSFKNDVKKLNRIIKKDFKNCEKIK